MRIAVARVDEGDKLLVPGDLHFDRHDPAAIDIMLNVAAGEGVNSVCLVGDTFESAGISRHKSMRKASNFRGGSATIKSEAAAARPFLAAMQFLAAPAKRHVITGNHCAWWSMVQEDYPGLMDTPWHEMYGDLFDGWRVHAEGVALQYGKLLVCHGHQLRGSLSRYSAASVLANYPGQNTLYGHTHRIDEATTPSYKYGRQTANGAWTIGHLKDRYAELDDPVTAPHAQRHQQGFALVSFFDYGHSELGFSVEKVRIHRTDDDQPFAVVGGRVYR